MSEQPSEHGPAQLLLEHHPIPHGLFTIRHIDDLIQQESTFSNTPIQILREFLRIDTKEIATLMRLPVEIYEAKEKDTIFDSNEFNALCAHFTHFFYTLDDPIYVIVTPSLFLKDPQRPAPLQLLIASKQFLKTAQDVFSEEYQYELEFYIEQLEKAFELIGAYNNDEALVAEACAAFLRTSSKEHAIKTIDLQTALNTVLSKDDETLIYQAVIYYTALLQQISGDTIENPAKEERRLYAGMLKEAKKITGENAKKYHLVMQAIELLRTVDDDYNEYADPRSQANTLDPSNICLARDFHREQFHNVLSIINDALHNICDKGLGDLTPEEGNAAYNLSKLARQYWGLEKTSLLNHNTTSRAHGKISKLEAYTDSIKPQDYARYIRNYINLGGHHEYHWAWGMAGRLTQPETPPALKP